MTAKQAAVLIAVTLSNVEGKWYRARTAGERVSLAYLVDSRRLVRRPWRGDGKNRSSAFEYARPTYVARKVVPSNGSEQWSRC